MIKIETTQQNAVTIINIEGEVDLYSSPEVRKTLVELTAAKAPFIVINLEKVGYMDSSGLATLIEGLQQSAKYEGQFVLANLSKEVKDVFSLSRLDKIFEIFESLEEAIKRVETNGNRG